jgi:aspartate aminotransferase-like enzyme
MALMSGEGMAALWGALKSCIQRGDRVLAVSTGVFGQGVGEMAQQIGARVRTVPFGYDRIADPDEVEKAIRAFRPKMVTLVHCETPSGTLNPVAEIGMLVRKYEVPLYYVDAVSSAAGVPLRADDWSIDLCLVGTQKALSALPDLAMVTVSERAWEVIAQVHYHGYDALLPFRDAVERNWFPYTPDWAALAGLHVAVKAILNEGLDNVFMRHRMVAQFTRDRARSMELELFPADEAACSPTVTALKVPSGLNWQELDGRLRERGVVMGGSLGPLEGKVFRIGHMGSQAEMGLVERGLEALASAIRFQARL